MIRFFRIAAFSIIFIFIITNQVFAQSSYVLPYPSSMPGGFAYKLHLVYEKISKYWYFGSLGQFEYNLKMADKYLVEAKTLFDYKQYLLGVKSLEKSSSYFNQTLPSLRKSEAEGKSVSQKRIILSEAALKHIEYLEEIDFDTPDVFIWEPEKSSPISLPLKKILINAINIRKDNQ